jgi:uncharacterized YccA/Bax inhibitor family protein
MRSFVTVAYWEGAVLVGGLFGIVLWKLFTGDIPLKGLLDGDVREPKSGNGFSSQASAGRAQSLTVTLFVALWYLLQIIHNPREFPRLSDTLMGALAGSQALYLGGKAQAMFLGRLRNLLK